MKTTPSLHDLLRAKYERDHVLAFEVSNAPGHGRSRSADCIAVGLWPSRGLRMIGHEIKVSRGDWLRELKQPAKAEAFVAGCHEWWLVTEPGGARLEELPPGWGLMERSGSRLHALRAADSKPKGHVPPWSLAVCVMRRVHEAANEGRVLAAGQLLKELRARDEERIRDAKRHAEMAAAGIIARSKQIKDATGIDLLHGWDIEKMAASVKAAQDLASAEQSARRAVKALLAAADTVKAQHPTIAGDE